MVTGHKYQLGRLGRSTSYLVLTRLHSILKVVIIIKKMFQSE